MKLSRPSAVPLFLLLLLLPASLLAISVFAVIRMSQARYSDEEVIRLIQITDSRFVLSAEDTVRLRREGVTESVIREMLSRPAPQRAPEPPESAAPAGARSDLRSGRGAEPEPEPEPEHEPLFAGSPYREKNSDRPAPAAVTLAGIEVLIVRDPARFSSPLARARSVAHTLNGLAAHASGRFAARAAGPDANVTFEVSGGAPAEVIRITPADVEGFRVGNRRPISAGTLASFWAALLNDYWAVGVSGRPPRSLVDSPGGQALERLSRAVRLPAGARDAAAVRAALNSLGRSDRESLRRLPTSVPEGLDLSIRRSP